MLTVSLCCSDVNIEYINPGHDGLMTTCMSMSMALEYMVVATVIKLLLFFDLIWNVHVNMQKILQLAIIQ